MVVQPSNQVFDYGPDGRDARSDEAHDEKYMGSRGNQTGRITTIQKTEK